MRQALDKLGSKFQRTGNSPGQEGIQRMKPKYTSTPPGGGTVTWVPPPARQYACPFLNLTLHHRPRDKDTRNLYSGSGYLDHGHKVRVG